MTRRNPAFAVPAVAVGLLMLAGCAEHRQPSPSAATAPDGQVYQVRATVLQAPGTGPQLCNAVADSYPPQCTGPELAGWDWDAVDPETASGTTWGSYLLTGTWDGHRFTLTEPAEPDDGSPGPDAAEPDFTSLCPAPDGGWGLVDPATTTQAGLDAALTLAAQDPGYAGAWIDQPDQRQRDQGRDATALERAANDPTRMVLNLRFTGNAGSRDQAIRQVWGGALCLTGAARTEAELLEIQQQLHRDLPERVLGSGIDVRTNAVTAQVFVADPALQRDLDQRYGEGAVILDGWLRPVS